MHKNGKKLYINHQLTLNFPYNLHSSRGTKMSPQMIFIASLMNTICKKYIWHHCLTISCAGSLVFWCHKSCFLILCPCQLTFCAHSICSNVKWMAFSFLTKRHSQKCTLCDSIQHVHLYVYQCIFSHGYPVMVGITGSLLLLKLANFQANKHCTCSVFRGWRYSRVLFNIRCKGVEATFSEALS